MPIELSKVGVSINQLTPDSWKVQFGLYLPGIKPEEGYSPVAMVIHETDQFTPGIDPVVISLNWVGGEYDLWQATTTITKSGPGSSYGKPGKYLYRYQLLHNGDPIVFWFADPFAREAGPGTNSGFTLGSKSFVWNDDSFLTPSIDEMVVYELHIGEFARSFKGVSKRLDYLRGLGVNVIEVMPFTNVKESTEWGYTPLGFYCPDDRYGSPDDLKEFVNSCHIKGIAVILDAVYAHAHPEFAYNLVYKATDLPNPMMGPFAEEFFPQQYGTDFNKNFTQQYFLELNKYWIAEYHLDGFRYDYVPGIMDGPKGNGYANIVYSTYQFTKQSNIARFKDPSGYSRIIQCAENLPDPQSILKTTYSNCCWQNRLMDKCADTAYWNYIDPQLAFLFDPELIGYPHAYHNPSSGESFPVAPFQYLEQHDNKRFINRISASKVCDLLGAPFGDRSVFYKTQPYVIALYTGKGIPMLWQGQEICENWGMVDLGVGRNLFERPVHWEYFYDRYGKSLIRLYRILGGLRNANPALGSRGDFYYFNNDVHRNKHVIVFRRASTSPTKIFLVCINFSDLSQNVEVEFPAAGTWKEQIDESPADNINVDHSGEMISISIPSYYGRIYAQ